MTREELLSILYSSSPFLLSRLTWMAILLSAPGLEPFSDSGELSWTLFEILVMDILFSMSLSIGGWSSSLTFLVISRTGIDLTVGLTTFWTIGGVRAFGDCWDSSEGFLDMSMMTRSGVEASEGLLAGFSAVAGSLWVDLCSAASALDMLSCFFHLVRLFWNHIFTWNKKKMYFINYSKQLCRYWETYSEHVSLLESNVLCIFHRTKVHDLKYFNILCNIINKMLTFVIKRFRCVVRHKFHNSKLYLSVFNHILTILGLHVVQ